MSKDLTGFAELIAKILKTDRWVFIGCDGDMGEGKSCLTTQLAKAVAKQTGTEFSYKDNMTFQRQELKDWIDGDKDGKGQKPEYSSLLADEIISMFFKRNWFDENQIDGIELLNKCRDRHHIVLGNIPNFWDLDSAIYSIITFWVHIHERGRAWVFQKDRNPFAVDKWHRKINEKGYNAQKGSPYKCKGFLFEVCFNDWTAKDKAAYYAVRNVKRVKTEGQRKKAEKWGDIKAQRDNIINHYWNEHKKLEKRGLVKPLQHKDLANITGLTGTAIGYILRGEI